LRLERLKGLKIKNIRNVNNIKTDYAAVNYWSVLFRCDRDGPTASDGGGGLLCWGPSQYFKSCLIYALLIAL
jgi:hypothetical protein